MVLTEVGCQGMDWIQMAQWLSGSVAQCPVASSCEEGNKPWCCRMYEELYDQSNGNQVLKMDSAPWK